MSGNLEDPANAAELAARGRKGREREVKVEKEEK